MKDFASYSGSDNNSTKEEWLKEAQKFAASYEGKGESAIMREIYARAVEGKKNGTLTNEQIDAFYNQFAPMLDSGKRKKLQKLVQELKNM